MVIRVIRWCPQDMEKTFQSLERGQRGRVKLHELRSADGGPHGPMEKHLEQW